MAARKSPTKKKAAPKKVAKKKAVKKKAAKKKAVKKPASKKGAVKKKAATKKKAAPKKKAAAKTTTTKKTAAKKTVRKAVAGKKKAGVKKKAARKRPATSRSRSEDPELLIEAEPDMDPPELPTAGKQAPEEDDVLPEARRRGRPIPPLPDDEEEFVPFEPAERGEAKKDGEASKRLPRNASAEDVLRMVREGELHVSVLEKLPRRALHALVDDAGLRRRRGERMSETIFRLVSEGDASASDLPNDPVQTEGLLEVHPDGYGFLRTPARNYSQHPTDVYVSAGLIRKLGLQQGHWLTGTAERPNPRQPQLALHSVEEVNHDDPARVAGITPFEKLTVVYPDQRLMLETAPGEIETRVIDLFCPLGMGQRGLIVAPPRTGKTVLLQKIADAVAMNSPEVDIVVLLVDERPEEVTNMRRSVRGEVIASTFDRPASNHVRIAELVVDKVKRMVELGRDVVLLLDSITRMGRAYNNQTGGTGRILSGGLDANALTKPKRFFGSARNVEHGGSLTIVATALIDTGSKMDEVIFEEFKGTGNMEIVLDRDMSNNRVWPAIDLPSSGTRNEDLLLHPDELRMITLLRRGITGQDPITVMTALRTQLKKFDTNAEFLISIGGQQ